MPDDNIIKFEQGTHRCLFISIIFPFIIALASLNIYISMLLALNKSSLWLLLVCIGGMLFAFVSGRSIIKFRMYSKGSEKAPHKPKAYFELAPDSNGNICDISSTMSMIELARLLIIIIIVLLLCIAVIIIGMVFLSKKMAYMITLFVLLSFVELTLYYCLLIICKLTLKISGEE